MKRMLIDDTQPEETRVVILDGNKVEDVEFESSLRKQIKSNIYTAKVIRIEPSLQAAFVDYGGNRHGFLAFGEIHPDYYNVSDEVKAEVEKEVDEIIEHKRQYQAERKAEQERRRLEREQKRAEYEAQKLAETECAAKQKEDTVSEEVSECTCGPDCPCRAEDGECHCHEKGECHCENCHCCDNEKHECTCGPDCPCRAEDGECHCHEKGECHCENCHCCDNEKHECTCGPDCPCRAEDGECHCHEKGECHCENCHCCDNEKHECTCGPDCPCRAEDGECHCHEKGECHCENCHCCDNVTSEEPTEEKAEEVKEEVKEEKAEKRRPRRRTNRFLGRRGNKEKVKVSTEACGIAADETVSQEVSEDDTDDEEDIRTPKNYDNDNECETNVNNDNDDDDDDDDDSEHYLEIQRKLIYARKLYHRSTIQDVIKEGQTLLIQIVKEERGNKGAACTTYLSLAGRYCVLMPNRIKSGGVSRKITSANDRKRLKEIIKELPLNDDMSLIIRTAGEDKKKSDIIRDYNYLIRTWNHIRYSSLSNTAPCMIYEEGNLIKRSLRDMYTKDIDEVIIDGDNAYKTAKEFSKILSPNIGRKIKCRKPNEIPVFQKYQVEKELDKLHNPIVQLESGGYLVINPTEALVSIDVNSGRATHEMDIEETALNTNLEAADEIAKQLRMRNLAGLVVVDFIDMEDPANNHAVEKRMKEAMKPDRARVQIAKMSIFGLLEISRQRMHSSFVESNYVTCPYCRGQGVQRTTESSSMLVLHAIEEEGIKGNYNSLEVKLPHDIAIYILNHKRRILADLEEKYNLDIVISADSSIKNICDYKIEKSKVAKAEKEQAAATAYAPSQISEYNSEEEEDEENSVSNSEENTENNRRQRNDHHKRRSLRSRRNNNRDKNVDNNQFSSENNERKSEPKATEDAPKTEKKAWWKKLLG